MVQTQNRLGGLDGLRGVAACTVIFYHAARHLFKSGALPGLHQALQFGHAGVDLFFVISGFVILTVHGGDIGVPGRLGRYATRRFNRIAPPYWVAMALSVAMAATHGLPSAGALLWNATLLPTPADPLVGVAWTLQHEALFYATFAVLIFNRRAGVALFGAWAIGIAVALVWPGGGRAFSPYNAEFFVGMAAARAVQIGWVPRTALPAGIVLLGLAALGENTGVFDGYAPMARLFYALPSALIVAGVVAGERAGRVRAPAWAARIGRASYSIYLFQFVFIGLAWKALAQHIPPPAAFVILCGAAVAGGMIMSWLVERPVLPLGQWRVKAAGARV